MIANVAIGVLEYNNKFLLVKRKKGNFPNLWGLIGGKVEEGEHIDDAIIRELKEETEISVTFSSLLGVSTEMVTDNGNTSSTIIYCCLVKIMDDINVLNTDSEISWFSKNEKLELKWFTKEELETSNEIIGSDMDFMKYFYFLKSKNYLRIDCKRDEKGSYTWEMI